MKNRNNPLICYLNINHLRNKVIELRPVVQDLEPTILTIAETKLNDSFPSAQFRIEGYYCPKEYRKDRTYNSGGGLLIYIKKGTPTKRLQKLEPLGIESIFIEINIKTQKWCIINVYRSEDIKVDDFLSILSKSLDQVLDIYENIMIIGDMNINFTNKNCPKLHKLKTFCDTFDLKNLI
jgi:exonuclease III